VFYMSTVAKGLNPFNEEAKLKPGLYKDAHGPVKDLDPDNFDETIMDESADNNKVWIVEFYSDRCPICKGLVPEVKKAAEVRISSCCLQLPTGSSRHSFLANPHVAVALFPEHDERVPGTDRFRRRELARVSRHCRAAWHHVIPVGDVILQGQEDRGHGRPRWLGVYLQLGEGQAQAGLEGGLEPGFRLQIPREGCRFYGDRCSWRG
jgi:hypothetical protein